MFATPWKPTAADGTFLPPSELIATLVKKNVMPNPAGDDKQWSKPALRKYLNSHPSSKDAVWEAILTLWRLMLVDARGSFDELWQKNVIAWLVRLRLICGVLQLTSETFRIDTANLLNRPVALL